MLYDPTGNIVYWGWVDRSGKFIFVDNAQNGHEGYCEIRGLNEDKDFMNKGFVKTTQSASGGTGISYWYTCKYKMTQEQARWLRKHGVEILEGNVVYQ